MGPRPPLPGNRAGDVAYFVEKRDVIRRALERAGRDPADFTFAAHVDCGSDARSRTEALDVARAMHHAGADHIILGIPASGAPQALAPMAHEVAQPLMESF
jgi:2-methylisocitrate lyase-like PEP mutase family enzyme